MSTSRKFPQDVSFCEARHDQLDQCNVLAATAFAAPLSQAEYLEREDYMNKQPLASNSGVRTWCLSRDQEVLATCKTVRRRVLVTDPEGSHEGIGYCIASVVTHPKHRGLGYASKLLEHVARWLDETGNAPASVLYSAKESVSRLFDR